MGRPSVDAAHWSAFVEQDAVGVAETDPTGQFVLVNQKFCEITGYTETELKRLRFQDLTHPDDLPQNLGLFDKLLKEGKPYGFEKRYVRKGGETVWVYLSVTRIQRGRDRAPTLLAVVLDLSERHRIEAEARKAAERFQSLFHSIDAGFCIIEMLFDESGRPVDYIFRAANAQFAAAAGFVAVPGLRMREAVPRHEQHWFDYYGRVATTGAAIRFEQEAKALNRRFSVYAFRVGGATSREVGVIFEDITARKQSEMRDAFLAGLAEKLSGLREENAIIQTAVEALGRFLSVDHCFFAECHESENRVRISAGYARPGVKEIPREVSLFDFGGIEWWREFARGDFAVSDVAEEPLTRERAEPYLALGVRAYAVQPFKQQGAWTVVLAVTDGARRAWRADELRLIDHVSARVWPLVERARQEHALLLAQQGLERRVQERTTTLQETIAELESYSYSISHDLRAPLRAIQTYTRILLTEHSAQLDRDGKEFLRRINVATDRMDRLIRDVLVYSSVARDSFPAERIELSSFIASVIESYPDLADANATIELASPLGAVRANPAALTQCVSNLLANAIKFTPETRRPMIRISAKTMGERVRVLFRDNGQGIPESERDRIFGMFYRVDQSKEGTGVGLAVVRRAAERMGGEVGVQESDDSGSTFWLELPAAKGD